MKGSFTSVVVETVAAVLAVSTTRALPGRWELSRRRLCWFVAGFSGGLVGASLFIRWALGA